MRLRTLLASRTVRHSFLKIALRMDNDADQAPLLCVLLVLVSGWLVVFLFGINATGKVNRFTVSHHPRFILTSPNFPRIEVCTSIQDFGEEVRSSQFADPHSFHHFNNNRQNSSI
jgi:hypothetical protein